MSTTATIAIRTRKETWFFYKHHDGYPEWTGQTLARFLKDTKKNGTPATADEALARINQADNRDDIQWDHTEPTTAATHIDGNGADYQYLVDLTDQGATRPDPNKETPQDAAARFWKRIKDGQGETDGAEIETWLQENTPEGDHRRETRIAISAGAEPMNLPTLTPRFTEQDLRDILGDTQKDLLAAWKRAETADEMLEEIKGDNAEKDLVNPETGNPWKDDYNDKKLEIQIAYALWAKAEKELNIAIQQRDDAREETKQARKDHQDALDRLVRSEIRSAINGPTN